MKKFLIIAGVVCLLCAGCVFAVSNLSDNDFKKLARKGTVAFQAEDYKTTIKALEEADKIKKDQAILCVLGMAYAGLGDIQKAEEIFKEAIRLFPEDWQAYTLLGDIKRSTNEFVLAIEYYKKALSLPSMPKDKAPMYKSLIEHTIAEQKASDKTLSNPDKTAEIELEGWHKAYSKGENGQYIVEYVPDGEDVEYKWTKLITINFFDSYYSFNVVTFKKKFISLLHSQARTLNSRLILKEIKAPKGEAIFKWTIKGRGESEITRIMKTKQGLYVLHYAHKKDDFTEPEQELAIKILNSLKE